MIRVRRPGRFLLVVLWLTGLFAGPAAPAGGKNDDPYRPARTEMVAEQIRARGISDQRVLDAMTAVPRHRFVPDGLRRKAYGDHPLPIGDGQTISQPYIVALMTDRLRLSPTDRVLEVGTGSGYQAAVLAQLGVAVFTIEIKPALYASARKRLSELGFEGIRTRQGDGYFGWDSAAPFDAIMITAAVDHVPPPLLKQLRVGGRLILPLGNPFSYQNLVLVTKTADGTTVEQITGVLFVPMTGRALN
jgi:protein-L-isoaspartate(D-aspartate) O-methyltransferase